MYYLLHPNSCKSKLLLSGSDAVKGNPAFKRIGAIMNKKTHEYNNEVSLACEHVARLELDEQKSNRLLYLIDEGLTLAVAHTSNHRHMNPDANYSFSTQEQAVTALHRIMADQTLHNSQKLLQYLGVSDTQTSQKIKEVLARKNFGFLNIPEIDQDMDEDDDQAVTCVAEQVKNILDEVTHLTDTHLAAKQRERMHHIEINTLLEKTTITAATEATAEVLAQQAATGDPEKISDLIKAMAQKELANEIKKLKREMRKNFSAGGKNQPNNTAANGNNNANNYKKGALKQTVRFSPKGGTKPAQSQATKQDPKKASNNRGGRGNSQGRGTKPGRGNNPGRGRGGGRNSDPQGGTKRGGRNGGNRR